MKDITQVLRDKETRLGRLNKEIKVLRVAAKLSEGEGYEPVHSNPDVG